MTTININSTTRLKYDGLQYIPEYYLEGGDMVRKVGTDEMVKSKPKWVSTNTFHPTIGGAIKQLVKVEALCTSEYKSLQEYLDKIISVEEELLKNLDL